MRYIVDGYNLLHATGRLGGRVGPGGLERARASLLGLLNAVHATADDVIVVFDARRPSPGPFADDVKGRVHVEFAVGEEADDRIEELIAQDSAPKRLVVVSDDRRLRRAATRRRCAAWSCDHYMQWLDRTRKANATPASPEKPSSIGEAEVDGWLAEFGDGRQTSASR